MKQFTATTTINAPASTVWHILTDADGYPAWDTSMDHIEGILAQGERVSFHTKFSDKAFPVRVTHFEPDRRMVLTGGMPMGLF